MLALLVFGRYIGRTLFTPPFGIPFYICLVIWNS